MPPRPCESHVPASAERDGPPHSWCSATSVSTALTSLSLERAAARDTTLIAQQNSLPILWFSSCSSNCSCGGGSWEGSAVIMCIQQFSDGSFAAGDLACRPNCNWRKSVWKSIRRDRNPARQTKSHQAMWRARASTGLPPCHDLVAGGGEFLCPEELWESNDAHKISRNDCGCHERRNRNGLPRAVALEQQCADASPSAARVHRLRRSGLAEEFPRMDIRRIAAHSQCA